MLCAQDQLWRGVTGPPPVTLERVGIQHLHTAETAEQEFEEVVEKGVVEQEEATMRHACRNTPYGMKGMAAEVKRVSARVGLLCLGLPFSVLCFCT